MCHLTPLCVLGHTYDPRGRHHHDDILAGVILGSTITCLSIKYYRLEFSRWAPHQDPASGSQVTTNPHPVPPDMVSGRTGRAASYGSIP